MGNLIVHNALSVNAAFESPSPANWLELDNDSTDDGLDQLVLADALLMGRPVYEGLSAVWPQLTEDPAMGKSAGRINAMPKYVASRTLTGPLEWNATLIEGELEQAVPALKERHEGRLIVTGCGEFAHNLTQLGLVDEFWFWIHPHIWPTGPRMLDGVGPVRLRLVSATPYRSGVVWLRYRPGSA
ncbi:dihydrofolate reductase family protein [Jiangella alkaliphila]|uniref:Dihydrofolate reductase n=1 Tax=Jiangella alkaliphila TaxID=419479 RepID=A0A1H2KI36_9ACTN|nr:dihydrofolate reductase family protein [Jiangella alkaliphila]SDU68377.1 Dihydrofolate reductase [Jiangella alkaliphila]